MTTLADFLIDVYLQEHSLSDDKILAMARKAVESDHPHERAAFTAKVKELTGKPPEHLLRQPKPEPSFTRGPTYGPMGSSGTPEWAWAGYSGGLPPHSTIHSENYGDLNYIKKRMWELSGKSKREHTIHQFDGSYFRNTYTAYGHEKIYPEMTKAMLRWGSSGNPYSTKAIFASIKSKPKTLRLLWANGQHVKKNIVINHKSFNRNPGNDHEFTQNLSAWIDQQVPPKKG